MKALSRIGMGVLLAALLLTDTSCIRSRVRITSEPSGAEVKFQGVYRGETPVTIPFIWYWYYDVDLAKEGYQPLHAVERFRTPPWFYFPFDFFADLLPIPISDTRTRHYDLKSLPTAAP